MLHVFLGFAGGWNPVDLIGRSNPKSGCGIDAAEAVCLTRELEDIFKAHSGYGTGIRIDSRLLIPRNALRGLNGGGSREGEVDVLPDVLLNIQFSRSDCVQPILWYFDLIEPSASAGNLAQEIDLPRIVGPSNVRN
jgi:hypothetical protein